jgi:acetyl-CoA carboxylase beta subunit
VHVSVPKAKILDTVIDENSVKVYDESQNAFNPIKITDYNEALKKEKETMIDDALKQGILKEANEQAKLAISALLQGLGFEKIEVTEEIALPELH